MEERSAPRRYPTFCPPGAAGINIYDGKTSRYTGKLQFVQITDPEGVAFLQALHRAIGDKSEKVSDASYQQYYKDLQEATRKFDLQDQPFTSHSARIGKATEDCITGVPVQQIAVNGRWKSLNSARYYLDNGKAWILNTKLSPHNQVKIAEAARRMRDLIDRSTAGNITRNGNTAP